MKLAELINQQAEFILFMIEKRQNAELDKENERAGY
jgi:hypothetical protein